MVTGANRTSSKRKYTVMSKEMNSIVCKMIKSDLLKVKQIAEIVGCHIDTVRNIRRRMRADPNYEENFMTLGERSKIWNSKDRKPLFDKVENIIGNQPDITLSDLKQVLFQDYSVVYSVASLSRVLKAARSSESSNMCIEN
eukprot:Platyproteum_vivax@DN3478_c0_g2_i1.p1